MNIQYKQIVLFKYVSFLYGDSYIQNLNLFSKGGNLNVQVKAFIQHMCNYYIYMCVCVCVLIVFSSTLVY